MQQRPFLLHPCSLPIVGHLSSASVAFPLQFSPDIVMSMCCFTHSLPLDCSRFLLPRGSHAASARLESGLMSTVHSSCEFCRSMGSALVAPPFPRILPDAAKQQHTLKHGCLMCFLPTHLVFAPGQVQGFQRFPGIILAPITPENSWNMLIFPGIPGIQGLLVGARKTAPTTKNPRANYPGAAAGSVLCVGIPGCQYWKAVPWLPSIPEANARPDTFSPAFYAKITQAR